MFIICKSCKKLIDADKHDFCPKCGANFSYADNLNGGTNSEDYKEYENNRNIERSYPENHNYNAQRENTRLETKRRIRNNANKQDGKKNGCIGCFVAVIFIFIAGSSLITSEFDDLFEESFRTPVREDEVYEIPQMTTYDYEEFYSNYYFDELEGNDDIRKLTVGYGETAWLDDVCVTCDEVAVVDDVDVPTGYTPLSFRLYIEKFSGEGNVFYVRAGTKLYADGEECMDIYSYHYDGISADTISAPGIYNAYVTFIVPNDTEIFTLQWYENTEIVIENDGYTAETEGTVVNGFYEEAYINNISIMCTDLKEMQIDYLPPADGYMYAGFGLCLTNHGEESEYVTAYTECFADGEECAMSFVFDDPSFMSMGIELLEFLETYEGYVCFEVPKDAEKFELHYENVVIEIENTLR